MPFALTIFLSAFLLFSVQLMLGKFLLPWFGGSPAAWTTCMLFFQVALLLGYGYAHLLGTRLSPARQAQVHLGVIYISVGAMVWLWWQSKSPILPPDTWKPTNPDAPVSNILKVLAGSIGLPFLLLAATVPLLQKWFSLAAPREKPYRLYALSNAGSLLGLLAFPFLMEPLTPLSTQAETWGICYILFVALCSISALRAARIPNTLPPHIEPEISPAPLQIILWLTLAALSSAMLLAVTNQLCQEIAAVPLLWVLPLTLYLASFVASFAGPHWYWRGPTLAVLGWLSVALIMRGSPLSLAWQIANLDALLLAFCLMCHGELARLKPGKAYATRFYLVVALGGALGGVFVALIAPHWFDDYWELPLTLAAGWLVLLLAIFSDPKSLLNRTHRWPLAGLVLLAAYPVFETGLGFTPLQQWNFYWRNQTVFAFVGALTMMGTLLRLTRHQHWAKSKQWARILALVIAVMVVAHAGRTGRHALTPADQERNFYGVVRVTENLFRSGDSAWKALQLMHGQVNHGIQFQEEPWRKQPVSYYSTNTGIELAFRLHPRRENSEPLNIGVMGLGVGTIAAFAKPGDSVRFYEINPAIIELCSGVKPRFSYVRDCRGQVEIVAGDARLALAAELAEGEPAHPKSRSTNESKQDHRRKPGEFDILVMDAFSGGTIPVHLLTAEAFEIYRRHLRDDRSVIAVNISNHYLDFSGLMAGISRRFGWGIMIISSRGAPPDQTASRWCLLTPNRAWLEQETFLQHSETAGRATEVLWTDDFSNPLKVLR